MKDDSDNVTTDLFGNKRTRGRPKTGTAKTGAERQAAYRAKQLDNNVTVTINRRVLDQLDAQMQAIRNGGSAVVLTSRTGRRDIEGHRTANQKQLRGQRPLPKEKPASSC